MLNLFVSVSFCHHLQNFAFIIFQKRARPHDVTNNFDQFFQAVSLIFHCYLKASMFLNQSVHTVLQFNPIALIRQHYRRKLGSRKKHLYFKQYSIYFLYNFYMVILFIHIFAHKYYRCRQICNYVLHNNTAQFLKKKGNRISQLRNYAQLILEFRVKAVLAGDEIIS